MLRKRFMVLLALMLMFGVMGVSYADDISGNPVKGFLSSIEFYPKQTHKNLSIVMIKAPEYKGKDIISLEEALKNEDLTIKEVNQSGSVNNLHVWNNSDKYVFIMAGEILAGSKQDRVLQNDVLLPPKSKEITINVFCVEHGRWSYKSDKFYSKNQAANISVRQTAKMEKNQSAVWQEVDKTNAKIGASAPTQSLSSAFDSKKFAEENEGFMKAFKDIRSKYPKANGVIVIVNNKILVADIFSSSSIFDKLWDKLLSSYIIEAISKHAEKYDSKADSEKQFIKNAKESDVKSITATGVGLAFEFVSKKITGSGLIKDSSPVHIDIFPYIEAKPVKPITPIIRPYNNQNNVQQQIQE